MAATDLMASLFGLDCDKLSKNERTLIEIIMINYVYQELVTYFRAIYDNQMEEFMLNGDVIRILVNDLVSSNEYSIQAIASYTGYPEDVIFDLAGGMNLNPTFALSTRIIELHALSRREFYNSLIKRIFEKIKNN